MTQIQELTQRLTNLYSDREKMQEGIQANHGLVVEIGGREIDMGCNSESRFKSTLLKTIDEMVAETKQEMIDLLKQE